MPNDLVFLFDGTSVSVLDPNSGAGADLSVNLPSGLTSEIAVVGSEIFLAGGHLEGAGPTDQLIKLNLQDLSLTPMSRMREKRTRHRCCLAGNKLLGQYLYVVGGCVEGTVERYDLTANQWEDCGSMNEPRFGPGLAALDDKLYVLGGQLGNSVSRTVEEFDPHQGKWTYTTPMIKARYDIRVCVYNSKLYVVGGWGKRRNRQRRRSCEMFDPVTKVWREVPRMNEGRADCSLLVANGQLMVAGGCSSSDVSRFEVLEKKWIPVQHRNTAGQFRAVSVPVDDLSKEARDRFRSLMSVQRSIFC